MAIVKYNPMTEFQKLERDIEKFWQNGWSLPSVFTDTGSIDMYEKDGKLVAELSLPNFSKDEVSVRTDDGVLEISANHKEKDEKKEKLHYFLKESSNQFFRRVTLPEGTNADGAEANLADGVLKITMPMTVKKPAKEIKIK